MSARAFVRRTAAKYRSHEFEIDDRQILATPDAYHVSMTPKRRQIAVKPRKRRIETRFSMGSLRQRYPELADVPVIGMSGHDLDPADERSFTCFLRKPFSPSDVVFVLAQVAPLAPAGG